MRQRQDADRPDRRRGVAVWLLLLLLLAAALPGCGGCSSDSDEQAQADKKKKDEAEKKKKEKEKPDFVIAAPAIEPFGTDNLSRGVKPGHLFGVSQAMKTNNFDFVGELDSELTLKDQDNAPLRVPVSLLSNRPVVLPKGQQRYFEMPVFVPRSEATRIWLSSDLRSRGGGTVVQPGATPLVVMPPYQFYFYVLAREHLRYHSLDRLDAIRGPSSNGLHVYYRVVAPPLEEHLDLPSHPLAWTGIAYMLWDDVDPAHLSPDQQRAMLDWLHWGGQLIVSGPNTLTALRGSFLAPYLPATEGATRDIGTETLAPLSDFWTPTSGKGHRPLTLVHPWSGIKLVKAAEAEFVPHTGDLVVERSVGRGRIVVTAFRLNLRALQDWPGFDPFFNGVLLRHPPREFVENGQGGTRPQWFEHSDQLFDPRLTSETRYLSRDLAADGRFAEDQGVIATSSGDQDQPVVIAEQNIAGYAQTAAEERTGSGVAGWNDSSAVSVAASESLGAAAGIDIPKATFVAWMLAAYLVVLVPLNWALFRAIRRVEWAWVAVPVIAMVGAVVVTKAANLNIGFARSQTEIALLELQPGYRRGHLTRYTNLYTSLSTSYDVRFDDPYAVVQPLVPESQLAPGKNWEPATYTLRHEADVRLAGFGVSSNSASMLHSEQMIDAGGAISVSGVGVRPIVFNRTSLTFDQAAVVRVVSFGQLQVAWLGPFPPGEAGRPLEFHNIDNETPPLPEWHDDPAASPSTPTLSLKRLMAMVVDPKGLKPGDVRLVASLSQPLPGMDVDPVASQSTRAAVLVVAHLQYAPRPAPQADHGSRLDPPKQLEIPPIEPDSPPPDPTVDPSLNP